MDNHLLFYLLRLRFRSLHRGRRLNHWFRSQAVDICVDICGVFLGRIWMMSEVTTPPDLQQDLHEDLLSHWSKVVSEVGGDGPNRAVLQLAKPLGLLKGAGTPNL